MKKIKVFHIIVIALQLAGLIYGILNEANDIISMCIIFISMSLFDIYNKSKFWVKKFIKYWPLQLEDL